ncbi:hypothetical protein FA09DRAFT_186134 [Tilletiopsis washingtonensis]|uniref:Uncharacterized protein n=1 Tax=Tilletiopsis washingtonensis TaxID=58919 RepID=A0A316ZHC3_9BASI|nr:hypothetical protein FA09DRAFT_186134 [Tilletiopsis washingtonensis]PWO00435.1 hypothetical protein FA09DRAFT_186134 [Tilletiopsis washingtonensis]
MTCTVSRPTARLELERQADIDALAVVVEQHGARELRQRQAGHLNLLGHDVGRVVVVKRALGDEVVDRRVLLDLVGEEGNLDGQVLLRRGHDGRRRTVRALAEEEDLAALRELNRELLGAALDGARVLLHDLGDGELQHLLDLLVGRRLVVLDKRAVVHALQALERAHVQQHVNGARHDAVALAVVLLDLQRLAAPVRVGLVRRRHDAALHHLVAEELVGDGHAEALCEIGVVREGALPDERRRHLLALVPLVAVLHAQHDAGRLALALEHVDAVEVDTPNVRDRLHAREARQRALAQLDALAQALDELAPVERRQLEVLDLGARVHDVGEDARQRARQEVLALRVEREARRGAEAVARALVGGQQALALVERAQQPLLVDEGNLHDGLPVLLLAVEVGLEVRGVEVDDGRGRVRHQIAERLGDMRAAQRRQHAHELVEGAERLAEVEVKLHVEHRQQIRDLRRVVVVVEPAPRGHAVVVVVQHPLQALDVAERELAHRLLVLEVDVQLLAVVVRLPHVHLLAELAQPQLLGVLLVRLLALGRGVLVALQHAVRGLDLLRRV